MRLGLVVWTADIGGTMRRSVPILAMAIVAVEVTGSAMAAQGPLDAKAIQIVAKTFDFLSHKPARDAKVVVVGGAADLAAARSSLGKMAVSEGAAGDAAGAFAVLVNTPEQARAARAVNGTVLTVGSDVSCVIAGACLTAVETQPKVTIYVSRAVAQATGVEFDPNFKMLITEK